MYRHSEANPALPCTVRRAVLTVAFLGAGACAFGNEADFFDDTSGAVDSDTAPEDSLDDTSGWDGMTPGYWALEAEVSIEEGAPVPGDSSVTLRLLDAELASDGLICTVTWPTPTFEILAAPDAMIFHWWSVAPQEIFGGNCTAAQRRFLPEQVLLGIGELFPDVAAVLDSTGYGEVSGSLYGAYVQPSTEADAATWAFGIAATDSGYAGETSPVSAAPVPNGTYRVEPIFLLPLEGR
jgi:hypothetical protein